MWLPSWLRRRTANAVPRRRASHRPAGAPCRPRLEVLEDRWLPSQIGLTVNSLADSGPGSLRDAIQTADAGSPSDKYTIGFSVTGKIDLQSPLPYFRNTIAIQGPGANSLTVERAAGVSFTSRMMLVAVDQTASLSGLTIANGNDGGILNAAGATLTVSDCAFTGNSAPDVGGGAIANGGIMTVRNSRFSGNSAASGGAIQNGYGGSMTISGCVFTGNVASTFTTGTGFVFGGTGGAIANSYNLAVRDCTFTDNSALYGGAIYSDAPGFVSLAVRGCTFSCNTASGSGGGIYNLGTTAVQQCTLSGNTAANAGGGVYNAATGSLTVDDSTVLGNSTPSGADIYNLGALILNDSIVGVVGP